MVMVALPSLVTLMAPVTDIWLPCSCSVPLIFVYSSRGLILPLRFILVVGSLVRIGGAARRVHCARGGPCALDSVGRMPTVRLLPTRLAPRTAAAITPASRPPAGCQDLCGSSGVGRVSRSQQVPRTSTRHVPQAPSPPHTWLMTIPISSAHERSVLPAGKSAAFL